MPAASPLRTASLRKTQPRALSAQMVRRRRPLLLAPPVPPGGVAPAPRAEAASGAALRFFVTCYAAGLVFFLVMLS